MHFPLLNLAYATRFFKISSGHVLYNTIKLFVDSRQMDRWHTVLHHVLPSASKKSNSAKGGHEKLYLSGESGVWGRAGADRCDGCRTARRSDLTELTLPDGISGAPWVVCVSQTEREINKGRVRMLYLLNLRGNVKEKRQKTQIGKVCLHRCDSKQIITDIIFPQNCIHYSPSDSLLLLLSTIYPPCLDISYWIWGLGVASGSGRPSPWRAASWLQTKTFLKFKLM